MKKLIFFVCIALAIVGCCDCDKKDKNSPSDFAVKDTPETTLEEFLGTVKDRDKIFENAVFKEKLRKKMACQSGCLDLTEYKSQTDANGQISWLQKYGKAVCLQDLYSAVQKDHFIQSPSLITSTRPITLKKKWSDITTLIGTNSAYEMYISFKKDINGDLVDLEMISKCDPSRSCYSIPLFQSMFLFNDLKNNDEFEFKIATVNGNETVIFSVVNNYTQDHRNFDFSDNPQATANGLYRSPL